MLAGMAEGVEIKLDLGIVSHHLKRKCKLGRAFYSWRESLWSFIHFIGDKIHGRAEVVITVTGPSLQTLLHTDNSEPTFYSPNIVTASELR